MIIVADLHQSRIQEVTELEMTKVNGGVSPLFPDININVGIVVAPVIQINAFTSNTSNYANININN